MGYLFKCFKTRILVFALITGLPFQMCSPPNDDCNCGEIDGKYFDVNGIDLFQLKNTEENSVEVILEDEIVQFEDYGGFYITYMVDYISAKQKKIPSFSFIYSAYACSCVENGYLGSKFEKLSNITVITLNDFDDSHRANDIINDLILVENQSLSNFLEDDTENINSEFLRLTLDRKPILDQNFKVKVIIELSTGEFYEDVSNSIILQ